MEGLESAEVMTDFYSWQVRFGTRPSKSRAF